MLSSARRIRVSQNSLSLRDLLALVESGVYWWQQRLKDAEGVNRERAAAAIKDLSRILDSLSQQLAQGRETVRITTRLPTTRIYAAPCAACGRGNRAGAKFCLACGALLSIDSAVSRSITAVQLKVAVRSDVGMVRQRNEDMCYAGQITTSGRVLATLLLVADGMGGEQAGDEASRLATETVKQELVKALQDTQPTSDEEWQSLLRQVVLLVNRRVYAYARANRSKRGMGTTLTVVAAAGNRAHLAHVGDSRAYLVNVQGVSEDGALLMQLTTDHSLVARLVDIGQLTSEQARSHPHRNMLYRAIGTDPAIDVDTSSQPIEAGDVLLLCSDGLTGHVEDAELTRIALATPNPETVCGQLVRLANSRGGRDNISVVVAKVLAHSGTSG
ncbi:MAG: Stp1/IreP family PP2C-type Ser/Thr phosphatase [Chloroflexales bacterium]|nr:Stp1/IreP family PP2C-type Ser/Thr phosphatase [Chloroflexales bacterium]